MRVVVFVNNSVGWKVTALLREWGESLVGVVLHPEEGRQFGAEILVAAGVPKGGVLDALRSRVLDLFPGHCVNIHRSFLSWGRGAHSNVWSIVEGTPAGATLHYMDAGESEDG
jgi:methionyl-tRNA formyltransferase